MLERHRTSDGGLVSTVNTRLRPVAISPAGDRFVGFSPDTPRLGSLVLANLDDGRAFAVIDEEASVLHEAFFSTDCQKIVFVADYETCKIMKSPDLREAVARLEQLAIDPALAAAAEDLLDYRERFAANYENEARKLKEAGLPGARDKFEQALKAWEGLSTNFPNLAKYKESLAAGYEYLAADDGERQTSFGPLPPARHLERAIEIRKQLVRDFPSEPRYKSELEKSEELLSRLQASEGPALNE